ncbi:MAG: plastocyanin/azurin family copper-binding protein [Candidatus Nitrosocosmicus sp.]
MPKRRDLIFTLSLSSIVFALSCSFFLGNESLNIVLFPYAIAQTNDISSSASSSNGKIDNATESDNIFNSSSNNNGVNERTVVITKGSANPEVDITKLAPRQWYTPREIAVNVNDTIKWTNNDSEPHTVTSGIGAGIVSLLTNAKGKPSGQFDSGLFPSGQSFSLKFDNPGTFNYFCTIHPWMEGVVRVVGNTSAIPPYAVNEFGKVDKFPLYNLTEDRSVEIGVSWNPLSILTGQPISFIMDFYQFPQNSRLHLWPYNFALIQDGKEIYRKWHNTGWLFQSPTPLARGKTIIKIESSSDPKSFAQFGTIAYKNPYGNTKNIQNVSNRSSVLLSPLTLVYFVYAIIIGIPLATVVIVILYKKNKI